MREFIKESIFNINTMTTLQRQNLRAHLLSAGFRRTGYSGATGPNKEIYTETWRNGENEVVISWGPKTPEVVSREVEKMPY